MIRFMMSKGNAGSVPSTCSRRAAISTGSPKGIGVNPVATGDGIKAVAEVSCSVEAAAAPAAIAVEPTKILGTLIRGAFVRLVRLAPLALVDAGTLASSGPAREAGLADELVAVAGFLSGVEGPDGVDVVLLVLGARRWFEVRMSAWTEARTSSGIHLPAKLCGGREDQDGKPKLMPGSAPGHR